MPVSYYPVLTIAGSDPSGGAGIQADIKAISAQGCYAMSAITAITAQNTVGVRDVMTIPGPMIEAQIDAVLDDIPPLAVKTGMLPTADAVLAVSRRAEQGLLPSLVVDPVLVSTSGHQLVENSVVVAIKQLIPLAILVTPNVHEARVLTGSDCLHDQIEAFRLMGAQNVLFKGGDSPDTHIKTDTLVNCRTGKTFTLSADAVKTPNTHGTGCTLSATIAARLALGDNLRTACCRAKEYLTNALAEGADVRIGHGHGPVKHFFSPKRQKTFFTHDSLHQ